MALSSGALLPCQPLPEDDDAIPADSIRPRPGDFTLRLAKERRAVHGGSDIDRAIKAAYDKGYDAGVAWVCENYAVYDVPVEDDEIGIEARN